MIVDNFSASSLKQKRRWTDDPSSGVLRLSLPD